MEAAKAMAAATAEAWAVGPVVVAVVVLTGGTTAADSAAAVMAVAKVVEALKVATSVEGDLAAGMEPAAAVVKTEAEGLAATMA